MGFRSARGASPLRCFVNSLQEHTQTRTNHRLWKAVFDKPQYRWIFEIHVTLPVTLQNALKTIKTKRGSAATHAHRSGALISQSTCCTGSGRVCDSVTSLWRAHGAFAVSSLGEQFHTMKNRPQMRGRDWGGRDWGYTHTTGLYRPLLIYMYSSFELCLSLKDRNVVEPYGEV